MMDTMDGMVSIFNQLTGDWLEFAAKIGAEKLKHLNEAGFNEIFNVAGSDYSLNAEFADNSLIFDAKNTDDARELINGEITGNNGELLITGEGNNYTFESNCSLDYTTDEITCSHDIISGENTVSISETKEITKYPWVEAVVNAENTHEMAKTWIMTLKNGQQMTLNIK